MIESNAHASNSFLEALRADGVDGTMDELTSQGFFEVSDVIEASAIRRLANPLIMQSARLAFEGNDLTEIE